MHMRFLMTVLPMILLAGCGTSSDYGAGNYAFVVHEKYNHLKCKEIAANISVQRAEIARLEGLSARANQSVVGGLIAGNAYGPGLTDAHGNLRVLNNVYEAKNCAVELRPKA